MVLTLIVFLAIVIFMAVFIGKNLQNVCSLWLFKSFEKNTLDSWLMGVSPNGTFVKNAEATWDNSEAGIPEGWTIEYATE